MSGQGSSSTEAAGNAASAVDAPPDPYPPGHDEYEASDLPSDDDEAPDYYPEADVEEEEEDGPAAGAVAAGAGGGDCDR